ncbi:hypothetical protein SAMN05216489_06556 [Streptomyces sp. 3213]|nr:hypothetical protein SAMN05216489_06556 [Streptomyces sp. 3213] [Streptomyces sp. 3213.3]
MWAPEGWPNKGLSLVLVRNPHRPTDPHYSAVGVILSMPCRLPLKASGLRAC